MTYCKLTMPKVNIHTPLLSLNIGRVFLSLSFQEIIFLASYEITDKEVGPL